MISVADNRLLQMGFHEKGFCVSFNYGTGKPGVFTNRI